MLRLQGKGAVITGAGSGIGRAAALLFAREGASVLAVDRDEAAVADTADQVIAAGGRAMAVTADAGNEADVAAFVAQAIKAFGDLDILYANAGISGGTVPFLETTAEQWHEILRVNLVGSFLAIRHAAPHMVARGRGSIVCTASVAGLRANAAGAPYSASKAGVISLVQTAANALIGTGYRVAWTGDAGAITPAPAVVQAIRTEIGRPNSSMRLSAWTATSTSVARRRSVRERSPSPMTCLNRLMAASTRARLV